MGSPIRILNLFTIMNRGGAETMVMNYYRNINRTKVQFDFLVHRQERGAYDDEIEALGGKIYRMPPVQPGHFGEYKKAVAKFFDEHTEYSVIHSHMSELGYYVFREAKKRGIKCTVCHAHNAPHFKDETIVEKAKDIVRNYFKHKIRKYTDHKFICGIEAGEWLFGRESKDDFVMMNNAVDALKFAWDAKKAEEMRGKLALKDKFVVSHVGRFNAQKNHTFLIEIFGEIHKRKPNAVLLLTGAGELEEKIRTQVAEAGLSSAVRFMGLRDDINDILLASDVFLFPSLYEGLPVTLVEAQASGIKCIISDTIPDDCRITENIEIISLSKSAEFWAEQVLRYADGYERKNTFGDIVAAKFDIRENAEWLEEFYLNEYNK